MICPCCKQEITELTEEEQEIKLLKSKALFESIGRGVRRIQEGKGDRYEKVNHGHGHYSLRIIRDEETEKS